VSRALDGAIGHYEYSRRCASGQINKICKGMKTQKCVQISYRFGFLAGRDSKGYSHPVH